MKDFAVKMTLVVEGANSQADALTAITVALRTYTEAQVTNRTPTRIWIESTDSIKLKGGK